MAKGMGSSPFLRGLVGLVVVLKQRYMLLDRVCGLRIAVFKHSFVVGETKEILEIFARTMYLRVSRLAVGAYAGSVRKIRGVPRTPKRPRNQNDPNPVRRGLVACRCNRSGRSGIRSYGRSGCVSRNPRTPLGVAGPERRGE
jgi:hypothetical protein